jgi:hypothetical protein
MQPGGPTCAHTARQVVAQVIGLTLARNRVRLISAASAKARAAVAPVAAEIGWVAAVVSLGNSLLAGDGQYGEQEQTRDGAHLRMLGAVLEPNEIGSRAVEEKASPLHRDVARDRKKEAHAAMNLLWYSRPRST